MSADTEHAQPYTGLSPAELILRDRLAIDRTVLANERTLLAYIRTAVALLIAGISLGHLPYLNIAENLNTTLYVALGWLGVAAAVMTAVIGFARYRRFRASIRAAGQPDKPTTA